MEQLLSLELTLKKTDTLQNIVNVDSIIAI
jgi:hypothetical protein